MCIDCLAIKCYSAVLPIVHLFFSLAADDYDGSVQSITFIAGQSTTVIRVRIIDDLIAEESETFMASLTNPSSGLFLGDRSVVLVTIFDDDGVHTCSSCDQQCGMSYVFF